MMQMPEVIILAGGLGTRLRTVVDDRPKCMAPLAGRPFLEYLLDFFIARGFTSALLSVGYLSDAITGHFSNDYKGMVLRYCFEDKPLGTGGAVMRAAGMTASDRFFVANGDTLFLADLGKMMEIHNESGSDISMALRQVSDSGRYGRVVTGPGGRITGFSEKSNDEQPGLINAGIYLVEKKAFTGRTFPEVFSLERGFFQPAATELTMHGFVSDAYFIDIGVPEDYRRAETELPRLYL